MKNTYREVSLSKVESSIERQSLLRIIRRFEGAESMKRRENCSNADLRKAVEWNLLGRPVMLEAQAQN